VHCALHGSLHIQQPALHSTWRTEDDAAGAGVI
jgi:hypothetical protein